MFWIKYVKSIALSCAMCAVEQAGCECIENQTLAISRGSALNKYSKTALAAAICTALSAGHAGAATFNVTNSNDAGAGSLREALSLANGNAESDIIDLSSISGQTITLTTGQLATYDDEITLQGGGVTIDAAGNSRVLFSSNTNLRLENLTITGGYAVPTLTRGPIGSDLGGGIYSKYGALSLENTTVTGNTSAGPGGGIYHLGYSEGLDISSSTISGNTGNAAGGGIAAYVGTANITISDSIVSGNEVEAGGIQLRERLDRTFDGEGWGRQRGGVIGPGATTAGGLIMLSYYGDVIVERSTISGNSADGSGGLFAIAPYGGVTVSQSTLSGNQATEYAGAGVVAAKYEALVSNSTISGNTAGNALGGLSVYSGNAGTTMGRGDDPGPISGTTRIEFSTITGNSAPGASGGLYMSNYGIQSVNGSVISGNSAATDPDLAIDAGIGSGSVDMTFSLVGIDPSTGTLNKDATSTSLTGQNPQIGPLAFNGGPTQTHLPAIPGSPLIDAIGSGLGDCGTAVTVGQRGEPRPAGFGCDIGSVERGQIVEAVPVPIFDRLGLLLMAGLLGIAGLFGVRRSTGG